MSPPTTSSALVARRATAALGRDVQVKALRVAPGRWLQVEARGVQVANLPGGTRPAMAELERLSAEVDALSLLFGPTTVRGLRLDGLKLVLERGEGGARNWRFGSRGAEARPGAAPDLSADGIPDAPAPAAAPGARAGFPLLLDARLHAGEVMVRTKGGTALLTRLDDVALDAAGLDGPARLAATGAYNGVPLSLRGDLDPVRALRGTAPYGAKLRFEAPGTVLEYNGTFRAPLDVDGAEGALTLDADAGTTLARIVGATGAVPALRMAGTLERAGGAWAFLSGVGSLEGSHIQAATLHLREGAAGKPDEVAADLAFERLDLNELLGTGQRGRRTGADIPLRVDPAPDTLVDLHLTADALAYAELEAEDAVVSGGLTASGITVKELSLTALGARAQASGTAVPARGGAQVQAGLLLSGLDVQRLRQALRFGPLPVQGELAAQVEASASGASVNAALRTARMSAVVALLNGAVSREVLQVASTDLRALLGTASGNSPVACMLAAMDMRGGLGTVSPLRLRTAEGTVAGYGRFDLNRRVLDMTIGSEAETTGSLALDVPLRVSGSFDRPDIRPARWSAAGRAALAAMDSVSQLPPSLRAVAQRSECSRR